MGGLDWYDFEGKANEEPTRGDIICGARAQERENEGLPHCHLYNSKNRSGCQMYG